MTQNGRRAARPRTFAEWKAHKGWTDVQIAEEATRRGVEVGRGMIGHLIQRRRNAGSALARVLSGMTGLPLSAFLFASEERAA